jgi:DNA-binding beta-propeller fold protein YncE
LRESGGAVTLPFWFDGKMKRAPFPFFRVFRGFRGPNPFMRLLPLLALVLSLSASAVHAAKITLVAGTAEAPLKEPFGTEADRAGNLFILEMMSGNRLLKLDVNGVLTPVAGTGVAGDSGDGGPGLAAQFRGPHSLAVLPNGDVLIADTWNGRLRRFDAKAGTISAVPGWGVTVEQAKGAGPYCIALDDEGKHVYIADLHRVHRLALASGKAEVVAGNGQKGKPEDGAVAVDAPLVDPRAVAVDHHGNIYILERGGNALRVVDATGHIKTVVNAEGKQGATGDGGPALAATMNGPKHLCIDRDASVIIADAENNLVRRYSPKDGLITRVAGTGKKGTAGLEGDPLQCELARPHGVSRKADTGELFITDSYNNRVLKIVR